MRNPFSSLLFSALERRLVHSLLRNQSFRRGVERVARYVHERRHGKLPEDMGGTQLPDPDRQGVKKFAEILWDELKKGHRPGPPK